MIRKNFALTTPKPYQKYKYVSSTALLPPPPVLTSIDYKKTFDSIETDVIQPVVVDRRSGATGADVRVRDGRLHCQSCYSNDRVQLSKV
ncbi:hypothetical protein DICVIV_10136 [Dictyocaulus viviparus]|uniref:Uncharacterized protein n=1 Tax=Dictyocaulus viviparus TaxID=29172 RepID=A0A0D8XGR5_DICVI|nr:hypothetical protein DICVIV_10136 [Dictyocaulus viviparus]